MSDSNKAIRSAAGRGYSYCEGGVIGAKGGLLSPMKSNKGYFYFHIKYNKKNTAIPYHRFFAYLKYGGDTFKAECVRHLDGNRENNTFDNIALGTHKENTADIIGTNKKNMMKNAVMQRKFSVEQVKRVRNMVSEGKTIRAIAIVSGVSPSTIQQIAEGRTYKWVK